MEELDVYEELDQVEYCALLDQVDQPSPPVLVDAVLHAAFPVLLHVGSQVSLRHPGSPAVTGSFQIPSQPGP